MGSSQPRARTCVPCIGRRILHHCATREALVIYFRILFILLQPPEVPEAQEEYKEHIPEDIYIYKPPICKPWVSLGSEKEIEEESVKESTKEVSSLNMMSSGHLPIAEQHVSPRDQCGLLGLLWGYGFF